jgi:drug/metabolite transporter, DME family
VRLNSARIAASDGNTPQAAPARSGAIDILLAAALWGTTGTARTFAPSTASPIAVGAARIIGGGLLLILLALRGGNLRSLLARGGKTRTTLVLGAVCVAVYQTAFFAAVARTGVAVGTITTIGTAPVFAGILSYLTTGARPGTRWMIATAGAVLGCAALGGEASNVSPAGIGLAVLAGLGYAVYAVIASHLIKDGATDRAVVAVLFGGGGVLLIPVLLIEPVGWMATGRGLGVIVYLAALTTTFGYILYARGLRTTAVPMATTLGLTEPAVAALLGLVVLGEHLGGVAIGGLLLLGASLALLAKP